MLFYRYPDDSSVLSKNCAQWLNSKWSDQKVNRNERMVVLPMFIPGQKMFIISQDFESFGCDNDATGVTTGDFWKIYIR